MGYNESELSRFGTQLVVRKVSGWKVAGILQRWSEPRLLFNVIFVRNARTGHVHSMNQRQLMHYPDCLAELKR